MTLRPVDNPQPLPIDPCDVLKSCPICGGHMETVYDRHHQTVCVCVDCHTGITVPSTAWSIAQTKRDEQSA